MTGRTRKLAVLLIATLALLLQACGGDQQTPSDKEPIVVKVQVQPYLSYGPMYIAEEEGYFAEQGIVLEKYDLRGTEAYVALSQGDLDVASDFLHVGFINATVGGGNIKIVADKGYVDANSCTVNGLVANKSLIESGEVQGPADMSGLTIAMEPETIEGYVLDLYLAGSGVGLEDIDTVVVPVTAEMDALAEGSIAMTATSEPWITREVQGGVGLVFLDYKDVVPDLQFAMLMYGPTFLEENPEAGERFMTAYLKGIRKYNEGKTESNIAIMSGFSGLDAELIQDICWASFRNDGGINVESIIDFSEWALSRGLLATGVTAEQIWDSRFVDHANQQLGTE